MIHFRIGPQQLLHVVNKRLITVVFFIKLQKVRPVITAGLSRFCSPLPLLRRFDMSESFFSGTLNNRQTNEYIGLPENFLKIIILMVRLAKIQDSKSNEKPLLPDCGSSNLSIQFEQIP